MNFDETFKIRSNLIVQIKRIPPITTIIEHYKYIHIKNSAYYEIGEHLYQEPFFLPKLYAALTCLTGPSDFCYDDYKGSYSFSFKLKVQKDQVTSEYFYHLYHYRSYIEFSVLHIVPESDPRNSSQLYEPNDQLFSDEDICALSRFFCGYCLGYIKGARYTPQPFVKNSDSNLLLFGYFENEYFIRSYDDQEEYKKQKDLLNNQINGLNVISTLTH